MKTFKEIRETDEQIAKKMAAAKAKITMAKTRAALKDKLKAAAAKLKKATGIDAAKRLAEKELTEGGRLEFDMSKMDNASKKKLIDLVQSLQFKRDYKLTFASVSMGKYLHIKAGYNDLDKAKKAIEKAGFKSPDLGRRSATKITMEGKMVWDHKVSITDGTMQMGIFDPDKDKAMEAARQLIFFLRKNKKTKIGKADPEQNDSNDAIAKYSEELSKLIFDDKLLDDLEPNGNNENQVANDIVVGRLRDLGVRIK